MHAHVTHHGPVFSGALIWEHFQSAFSFACSSCPSTLTFPLYVYCKLFTKHRIETCSMMCLFTQNDFPGHH